MRYLILAFVAFFGLNATAQSENPMLGNNRMIIPTFSKTPEGYTGTPYLEEEFKRGIIEHKDGRTMPALLRYNAVEEIMEIKMQSPEDDILVLPKGKGITYKIDGYSYVEDVLRTEKGDRLQGYFIEYYNGDNIRFLAHPQPDVIEPKKAKSGYEKDKPAHLKVDLEYYLAEDDERLKNIKLRHRPIKKEFSGAPGMKDYFSENKIKTVEDVIAMAKYYDEQL